MKQKLPMITTKKKNSTNSTGVYDFLVAHIIWMPIFASVPYS